MNNYELSDIKNPLIYSCMVDDIHLARLSISNGYTPYTTDEFGAHAFQVAAAWGSICVLDFLLDLTNDVTYPEKLVLCILPGCVSI